MSYLWWQAEGSVLPSDDDEESREETDDDSEESDRQAVAWAKEESGGVPPEAPLFEPEEGRPSTSVRPLSWCETAPDPEPDPEPEGEWSRGGEGPAEEEAEVGAVVVEVEGVGPPEVVAAEVAASSLMAASALTSRCGVKGVEADRQGETNDGRERGGGVGERREEDEAADRDVSWV